MAERRRVKVQISSNGAVQVVDPDPALVPLISSLGGIPPKVQIRRPVPRLWATRRIRPPIESGALGDLPTHTLWRVHETLREQPSASRGGASLLDVKLAILQRWLHRCTLCWKTCVVDRHVGQVGRCGLDAVAYIGEHFLHVAEEQEINPSYLLCLQGCSWRCRYCQQYQLLRVDPNAGTDLSRFDWSKIDMRDTRTLSFVGGNPDESAYAIVKWLAALPADFPLPIVWNTHGCGSPRLYGLLDGVVDYFVTDLRYGSDVCALQWSAVSGYCAASQAGLSAMATTSAKIIVRILVLPGHVLCCHLPALELLSTRLRDRVVVSVKGEYYPTYLIGQRDGAMAHRPSPKDVDLVRRTAEDLALTLAT